MSNQHVADETDAQTRQGENVTSQGTTRSGVLFIAVRLFIAGLYMMSLFAVPS